MEPGLNCTEQKKPVNVALSFDVLFFLFLSHESHPAFFRLIWERVILNYVDDYVSQG